MRSLAGIAAELRGAGCVFAEEEAALLVEAAGDAAELGELVARRVAGLPLEQLLGWAAFHGLRVHVEPGVFVPRRRTEFLAERAIAFSREPGSVVLDLCCGSGAIAAAVAAQVPTAQLHAADVDPAAVRCAKRNLPGAPVYRSDLFAGLPPVLRGRCTVVVANVPYVPTDAIAGMPPEARDHEPATALDGGPDGLDMVRRLAGAAPAWLAPGGHLLVEIGEGQIGAAAAYFADCGLWPQVLSAESATVLVGLRR